MRFLKLVMVSLFLSAGGLAVAKSRTEPSLTMDSWTFKNPDVGDVQIVEFTWRGLNPAHFSYVTGTIEYDYGPGFGWTLVLPVENWFVFGTDEGSAEIQFDPLPDFEGVFIQARLTINLWWYDDDKEQWFSTGDDTVQFTVSNP